MCVCVNMQGERERERGGCGEEKNRQKNALLGEDGGKLKAKKPLSKNVYFRKGFPFLRTLCSALLILAACSYGPQVKALPHLVSHLCQCQ